MFQKLLSEMSVRIKKLVLKCKTDGCLAISNVPANGIIFKEQVSIYDISLENPNLFLM